MNGGSHMPLSVLLALLTGVLIALQPVVNARLAQYVGTLPAATLSFLIGLTALLILTAATVPGGLVKIVSATTLRQVPPVFLTGGLIGAGVVYFSAHLIPRLGAVGLLSLTISGQLLTTALADYWGLFGIQRVPLGWARVAGLILLLIGARLALRPT